MEIPESDWKLLRTLKAAALERYCALVLHEVAALAADAGSFFQLARMRRLGLITDEEFGRFSTDTREAVELILGIQG
jgi:hypothetical protein